MDIKFVDLKAQYLTIKKDIDKAIEDVINNTAFIKGKYVEEFEAKYSEKYDSKYVVSCANGTDAIYIALKALGVGAGDEVITTALSWISTSETITQTGAKVVFVDIDEEDYTINVKEIEEKITDKTKAIIPVHLYGHPAKMDDIIKLALKYNIKIIEDCAQAHFAEFQGQKVGTFGDFGTFSFFPGKNLGAYGDAGCIITSSEELAIKAKMIANHGGLKKHSHEIEGINSRMDGIQAAILSAKLNYIDEWTSLRISHSKFYSSGIINEKIIKPVEKNNVKHVYHLYVIRSEVRDLLKTHLKDNGIPTSIHYPKSLPYLPAYDYLKHIPSDFPNAYNLTEKILSIPIYPEMSEEKIKYIFDKINSFKG